MIKKKHLFILSALCAALLFPSLTACNKTPSPPEVTTAVTDADSTTEPPDDGLIKPTDDKTPYKLIISSKIGSFAEGMLTKIATAITEVTGKRLDAADDWTRDDIIVTNDDREILIGQTNRAESQEVLSSLEDHSYAIRVVNNKIVIAATEDAALQLAVNRFIDECVKKNAMVLPADLNLTGSFGEGGLDDYLKVASKLDFYLTLQSGISRSDSYFVMQGACTDGTYAYYFINDGQNDSLESMTKVCKIELSSGTTVATAELKICHPNDAAYNSKTGLILTTNFSPQGNILTLIDAATLTVKGTKILPWWVQTISYNAERDRYAVKVAGSTTVYILDSNFSVAGIFNLKNNGWGAQGSDCDTKHLYFTQWDSETNTNYILVYSWTGVYITTVKLTGKGLENEVENLIVHNNEFSVGFFNPGNGGTIYNASIRIAEF